MSGDGEGEVHGDARRRGRRSIGGDGRESRREEPGGQAPRGPTPLGDALGSYLRKHGLDREVASQEALLRWEGVVGERIARVARPTGAARGVLYVEVRSSAWMNELNLMRHEILARLNAGREDGRIERILFRLAEDDPG